jgi:hypothetical protein
MKARYKRFYAVTLALTALSPVAACAAGRGGPNESPGTAAGSPTGVIGSFTYVDVLPPKGRARGDAAEQIATGACDRANSDNIGGSAFDACMLAHGWRFDSFEWTPPGAYLYDDILKPNALEWRRTAADGDPSVRRRQLGEDRHAQIRRVHARPWLAVRRPRPGGAEPGLFVV